MDFEEVKKEREVKHQKFLELQAKTPQEREAMGLSLQQDQCKYLGISIVTYNKYRKKLQKQNQSPDDDVESAVNELRDMALGKATPNMARLKSIELLLKRHGALNENKEDRKFELTVSDRIRIAREVVNGLREDYQRIGGNCPVCGFSKTLCDKPRMDTEPEHAESGEVATLGVSA